MTNRLYLLGVRIDNVSMEETLNKIRDFLNDGRQHYVVTPNPDFLVLAQKDAEFREILNKADLSLPDGIGVVWAARLMGEPLKERVVGVDLVEKILRQSHRHDELVSASFEIPKQVRDDKGGMATGIFLLGGFDGAVEKIAKDWPEVVGFTENLDEAVNLINRCQPNILLVALGAPKQEKWIAQNLAKIPSVKVAIGVGSAFDLISGKIKRAPRMFQALGLEWLWRTFREPWRWRKIIRSIIIFPSLVLREKVKDKSGFPLSRE